MQRRPQLPTSGTAGCASASGCFEREAAGRSGEGPALFGLLGDGLGSGRFHDPRCIGAVESGDRDLAKGGAEDQAVIEGRYGIAQPALSVVGDGVSRRSKIMALMALVVGIGYRGLL